MDAHSREYAGAVAGMADFYAKVWRPKPGDMVLAPRVFGGGMEHVMVIGRIGETDAYRVRNMMGEEPQYFLEELARI